MAYWQNPLLAHNARMNKDFYRNANFLAGSLTWLVVIGFMATQGSSMLALGLMLLFFFGFVLQCAHWHGRWGWLLAGASAVALFSFNSFGYLGVLGVIWCAGAPLYLPRRWPLPAALAMASAFVLSQHFHYQSIDLIWLGLWYSFHLFSLGMAQSARSEKLARQELESLNRELQATQLLLEETGRQAERLRIARDLHDSLGHQLTALAIGLQVQRRTHPQLTQLAVLEGQARDALGSVRSAVSDIRDENLDLKAALEQLAGPAVGLNLHLELCSVAEPQLAQLVFLLSREAITNTLRHAGASSAWLTLAPKGQGYEWRYRDNGKLAANWRQGMGLKGMAERVAVAGGTLQVGREQEALMLKAELGGG